MHNKIFLFLLIVFCCLRFQSAAQTAEGQLKITDANDALYLLKPVYKIAYGDLKPADIKSVTDRVLVFLDSNSKARLIQKETHAVITDFHTIDQNSLLEPATFRITSYEWGVTYQGMLLAAEVTGDKRYAQYVTERLRFLSDIAPYFRKLDASVKLDPQIQKMIHPAKLDDAGAMCTSMIKATLDSLLFNGRPQIDHYIDYIMHHQYRLTDGTLARMVPHPNTLWLDDMYMSIPAIVNMGVLTGDKQYFDAAIQQVLQFADRMFVPEKGLFRHGWVEGMAVHPAFHWGRANGWAILAMTAVLDALPENYPGRAKVMELFRAHIQGLAALQSGEGFWHQLLDRNDSYLETSCTAIFTYCFAHAINKGWIDALAYGPVAVLGWHAVASKVNSKGEVEGTCVGTGMGFDPAFYYYRPVHAYAAHGYGPVLLAGSEMIRLLHRYHLKTNDGTVQF